MVVEPHFAVGEEDGEFGRGEVVAGVAAFAEARVIRQVFDGAVQAVFGFQLLHQSRVVVEVFATRQRQAEGLRLEVVLPQDVCRDAVGHLRQQRIARGKVEFARFYRLVQEDFDVDFVVGTVDAAGVVDGVGVQAHAVLGGFDAAALGHAEVAAFADDFRAHVAAVDAQGVVGAVADLRVAFVACFDVGADAAVPDEVHRRFQQAADEFGRGQAVFLDVKGSFHFRADGDGFVAAREDTAALADERGVVVRPGRARQAEEALAFGQACRRVGVGVDEDVQVVEGGEQTGVGREQHAVAEDVATHVADADGGEGVVLLDVFAEQAEVALDRFPGAARGDADAFVVVTRAAAGGEGVAEPEAVFGGDLVGDVGEFGGAFVGGNDEVGVVFVMAHGVGGRDDFAFDEVVGEVKQAADEGAVAGFARFHEGVAVGGRVFDDEAAFRADRDDDGVFHHLRLDQPQHFGAEISVAVRPAQAAARHFAAAQMHAFDFGRVNPDFVERFGFGQVGDVARGEFEGKAVFRPAVGVFLVVVGAQQGGEEVKIPAQDGFVFGALYLLQTVLQFAECGGGVARLRPHFGVEDGDERGGGIRVGVERGADLFVVVGRARLDDVFAQCAQYGDFADVERGCEQERVQAVAVCRARPDAAEGVRQAAFHRFRRDGGGQGECVLL